MKTLTQLQTMYMPRFPPLWIAYAKTVVRPKYNPCPGDESNDTEEQLKYFKNEGNSKLVAVIAQTQF